MVSCRVGVSMKNKKKIIIIIIAMVCIAFWLYFNTGIKGFEKEISNLKLPENIEKIAIKSGIGDSGGNGDYSTYRVVLVVKTSMSKEELKQEFANVNYCYITKCENKVFESARNFKLEFYELEKIEDYRNYYFIEFIK